MLLGGLASAFGVPGLVVVYATTLALWVDAGRIPAFLAAVFACGGGEGAVRLIQALLGGLTRAIAELPDATAETPDLGPWLWPGGWLRAHFEDVRRLALSLYELEASGLRALLESATRSPVTQQEQAP